MRRVPLLNFDKIYESILQLSILQLKIKNLAFAITTLNLQHYYPASKTFQPQRKTNIIFPDPREVVERKWL